MDDDHKDHEDSSGCSFHGSPATDVAEDDVDGDTYAQAQNAKDAYMSTSGYLD